MSRLPKERKYTREHLISIIEKCTSWASVLAKLGLPSSGGNYRFIQRHVVAYSIDVQHFKGKAWNKGLRATEDIRLMKISEASQMAPNEILTANSICNSKQVRRALLQVDVIYTCECGNDGTWRGKTLTLHVDHINGDPSDNRRENLRFICPNCHQQTPTWGKRKLK